MQNDDDDPPPGCLTLDDVAAYVDDAIAPAERTFLRVHVERCSRCLALLLAVRASRKLVPPNV